jgi:uncharacterized protein (DUF983 family)
MTHMHEATAPDDGLGEDRPLWPTLARGWRRRCPACGRGAVFAGFLAVNHSCPDCGEELHHHRADDGPAYLTILIVGKVAISGVYAAFIAWRPDPALLAVAACVGATALALWLLPRIKGALIAYQWARRMHGFSALDEAEQPA